MATLLLCFGWAGRWSDLNAKLQKAPDSEVVNLAASLEGAHDPQLDRLMPPEGVPGLVKANSAARIRGYVALRAKFESGATQANSSAIQEIKQSSQYRKAASPDTSENWLGKAIDRIRFPSLNMENRNLGRGVSAPGLGGVEFVIWGLLGAAVLLLAYFAIKAFTTRRGAKRQSTAMLEDDEPERPLDEWLILADQLEREGQFREAVRCLYVACLLRFDEARVARFDRTHTNWEHFRRIAASPAAPHDFDFRTPTRDFDRIWYGHAFSDAADVQRFRAAYSSLTAILKNPKPGVPA